MVPTRCSVGWPCRVAGGSIRSTVISSGWRARRSTNSRPAVPRHVLVHRKGTFQGAPGVAGGTAARAGLREGFASSSEAGKRHVAT